jgi:hypothetical protein
VHSSSSRKGKVLYLQYLNDILRLRYGTTSPTSDSTPFFST